jgi:4a-hydroxytetrahydrobiopterin dehydratase
MKAKPEAELRQMHCGALPQSARLDAKALSTQMQAISRWSIVDDAVEREFTFADFHRTMEFVNAVAQIAHREDHHPDLQLGYGRCRVRWQTHSAGGVTINDFICAAQTDALLDDGR